jgi:hypothetical protein
MPQKKEETAQEEFHRRWNDGVSEDIDLLAVAADAIDELEEQLFDVQGELAAAQRHADSLFAELQEDRQSQIRSV